MLSESWTGKDVEGSDRDFFKVSIHNLIIIIIIIIHCVISHFFIPCFHSVITSASRLQVE
jgi:hypothetical protein